MSRFFVTPLQVDGDYILIEGTDVKHIRDVLRLDISDTITVCAGTSKEYKAELITIEKDIIKAKIIYELQCDTEPKVNVTLYQGIPKGDKMELIIQKAVELGVTRIVPIIMERSVVKFDSDKDKFKKTERWNRISMEAAKQCNRGIIPEVMEPITFNNVIKNFDLNNLLLMPYENEQNTTLKSVLTEQKGTKAISLLIGPEGGIAQAEYISAVEIGFKSVTLGRRILRTETAGFVVLAAIRYEWCD